MQTIASEPIELDDGYVLVNTEMLMELLAEGKSVFLPELAEMPEGVSGYSDADLDDYRQGMKVSEIESVVYVSEEEVQCIEIADEQHLYLTDGFTISHNTSNIVFLKSTDDQMLETLEKMSGKTHQVRASSKRVSRDLERVWMKNQNAIDITMEVKEEPVISYNDMAFIAMRNSIVFRAGDPPVWNRNETVLPMSWRLFLSKDKIRHPGHDYTLQTIPTLSSAIDFDVRMNQPDFQKMLNRRIEQALLVDEAKKVYQTKFGYSDYDIEKLDPDIYSDAIMDIVDSMIADKAGITTVEQAIDYEPASVKREMAANSSDNMEQRNEIDAQMERKELSERYLFAGGMLRPCDFISIGGQVDRQHEDEIIKAYIEVQGDFARDHLNFAMRGSDLWSSNASVCYIKKRDESESRQALESGRTDPKSKVYSDDPIEEQDIEVLGSWEVSDSFFWFLAEQDAWDFADGQFERVMARIFRED